jgi:methylmalonyl-CoA mutase N-terminal domain/subunit
VEGEAQALLDAVEEKGGALAAIERGDIQREIQESAYRFQREVESGERVLVGVNRFQEGGRGQELETLRVDPELERAQVERVRSLRARRDPAAWRSALQALEESARGSENLLPAIVDAVMAWATVGEVATCLRRVFGEHRENLVL